MKGRIGKYKDKIVVWGDPNLTAKNEINIDSLGGGGESQTGDSDSMNYYIPKLIDLSKRGLELYNELRKYLSISIPILCGIDKFASLEDWKSDIEKRIKDYSPEFLSVINYLYEVNCCYAVLDPASITDMTKQTLDLLNNFRYLTIYFYSFGSAGPYYLEIGGSTFGHDNNLSGVLCFSTPKNLRTLSVRMKLIAASINTSIDSNASFINPVEEALFDKETLNALFRKVSYEEYTAFIDEMVEAFGE